MALESAIMIHVIATVTVKPGTRAEFLRIFSANVPAVLAEDGCLAYQPTVDTTSEIPDMPALRENVSVVVEKWQSLDHLKAHLDASHMATFRDDVKDIVETVDLQVLEEA